MTSPEHRLRVLAHLSGRVSPLAPIGSLLKRPVGEQRKPYSSLGRKPRATDDAHLEGIRQCPCLKCGLDPCGEAAHVRMNCAALGKRTGGGERPSDMWAVPLCRSCHLMDRDSQHEIGEIAFWDALGINPLQGALALSRASADVVAMHATAIRIISERSV